MIRSLEQRIIMVYLIEDDVSVWKALQRLLRSACVNVRAFAGAAEFMQSGELGQGGWIVVDIQMPGLT
jgi:FixJ family two-component response regulator